MQAREHHLEAREVLAGAYLRREDETFLVHAIVIDEEGDLLRLLCRRVRPDSLCDAGSLGGRERDLRLVTCPYCLRGIRRWQAAHPENPKTR